MNHSRASCRAGGTAGLASTARSSPTRRLLLCDERDGRLDSKAGDEILDLLQALNKQHGRPS